MADIPDIYCDQFSIGHSPYGVAFTFLLTPSTPGPTPAQMQAEPKVVVRMSLEHAKVMAMVVRKSLRQYELEHLGDTIEVPRQVLAQLGLDPEDW